MWSESIGKASGISNKGQWQRKRFHVMTSSPKRHEQQENTKQQENTNTLSVKPEVWGASANRCKYALYIQLYQWDNIDGLVQERRNSIANALELRLSYTNPSIWYPGNWYPHGHWVQQQYK